MPDGQGRLAFVTLGCKVNQTESEAIASGLGVGGAGCAPDDADVVVINTCTVTGEADRKARKAVRHALSLPRSPIVIVTGCLATLDAGGLSALGECVVVEADKERVGARVAEALRIRGLAVSRTAVPAEVRPARARAQLKVEDGCDAFCTYCIVPYARGVPRAVPADRVVAEAERLVAAGASEIVLTGINIGRYDDAGVGLPGLLSRVAATGIARIRFSSIEPGDVTPQLLVAAQATPAFCAHLHVPLQSGSDAVLARMGRPYDTARYTATIEAARAAFPGIALSTDIIVGFPGETDAEFADTLAFARATGFSRLHVFRYSQRAGTPAAAMSGQVQPALRAERSAELRALGERMALVYANTQVGRPVEVLVERVWGDTAEGTTREYVRARVSPASARPGQLLGLTAGRVDPGPVLVGTPSP